MHAGIPINLTPTNTLPHFHWSSLSLSSVEDKAFLYHLFFSFPCNQWVGLENEKRKNICKLKSISRTKQTLKRRRKLEKEKGRISGIDAWVVQNKVVLLMHYNKVESVHVFVFSDYITATAQPPSPSIKLAIFFFKWTPFKRLYLILLLPFSLLWMKEEHLWCQFHGVLISVPLD